MHISDILSPERILPNLENDDKEGVLRELTTQLCTTNGGVNASVEQVYNALLNRERLGSTGVGEGVAIPHAKIAGLSRLTAIFGRSQSGIPFDAIDQQPVRLIFVLLVPENSTGAHLKALARISRLLKKESFREQLLELQDGKAVYSAFITEDERA